MKARTELLLYRMGWLAEMLLRPTWRTLDASFESWAYGSGLLRQIQRLESQAYLESRRDLQTGERLIRLTAKGVATCRAGVDPETSWGRAWDGKWRMVIFDIPELNRPLRARLRKRLASDKFGCLQQSVWISPAPFGNLLEELHGADVDGGSLTLMEGVPVAGETPADLVGIAWDFQTIGKAWNALRAHLESAADPSLVSNPMLVATWITEERRRVQHCNRIDPFLPATLLPKDYPGRKIWKLRGKILAKLAAHHSPHG